MNRQQAQAQAVSRFPPAAVLLESIHRAAVGFLFPTLGKIIFFSQTAVSSPTNLTVRLYLEAVESARERRTSLRVDFAYRLFTHPLA